MLILVAAWRMLTGCPSCTRVGEQHAVTSSRTPGGGTTLLTRMKVTPDDHVFDVRERHGQDTSMSALPRTMPLT